jgi:hypothetical protein
MTVTFDNLVVLALVAAAAGYLGSRLWSTVRGKRPGSGCGACANCPSQGADPGPAVISVESLRQSGAKAAR